jgi:outer membrane protein
LALATLAVCVTASGQTPRPRLDGPLSIAEAIRQAELNNPGLASAKFQVAAASASVRSARATLGPQLSANTIAESGSYSSILGSSPGVMPPYSLVAPNGSGVGQNLMLMLPLYTGGRLQSLVGSATWQRKAAEGDLAEMRADLGLRVQDAYLRVLLAKEMVKVAEAKAAAAEELLRTTQAQVDAGKGIEASVLRVKAELSRAQRTVTAARNTVAKSMLDLDAAIGVDFESPILLTDTLTLATQDTNLQAELAKANASRGRLLAAMARSEAATSDLHSAQAQHAPQIYGVAMGDTATWQMGSGTTVGITLSIPIFDGGKIDADVSSAKAQRSKSRADYADAAIAVENEVRQAWLDVQSATSNASSAQASVQAAQAAYDVVALRVGAGKAILVEQLDALQSLTDAKGDLAQAIYEHNIALAKLARATGGAR